MKSINEQKSDLPVKAEITENMANEMKTQETVSTARDKLKLSCEIDDVLTYAIVHNGAYIVRDLCLKNISESDIDNIVIKIDSDNELIDVFELGVQKIKPDEELHFKNLNITINANYLSSLTERSICKFRVMVCFEELQCISETKNITVLAFDQWPGLQYTPELLAAFAMPNHPVVISLLQLAAKYLDKWGSEPSFAGYQFDDPNKVKLMAAAAYAAIQQKNITYAEPPSSFEAFGQRIRLADTVLDQHMGTCMDMTLLYSACLEAMGLNPIMVMMRGHIFAGVWLIDESFSDMIMDDPSQLEKRMSNGINELVVVECTAMCAGKTKNFDDAVAYAKYNVSNYGDFMFVIDVKRARSMGIRPLPVRIKNNTGFEVQHEERKEKDITTAPTSIGEVFDIYNADINTKITKQAQWERKLLDMSMRNMLINMRMTKTVVPLLSSDVTILEDALADGEEFQVFPRHTDMVISGDGGIPVEALNQLGVFEDFIALEGKHRKLYSLYTEKELNSCLTKIYRSAKTSLEENGASTLYLALGLLRWFERNKDATARYAPIVLIPINIKRKSASKGYTMYMRDEDAQINITLLEFLKQNYDIQIPGLNPIPMDEHGADLPKIFAIIRRAIMKLPMWDVVEVGFIGNFSFSQFVMWNDIHSKSNFLENNKIVNSLISGSVDWDCKISESVDTDEAYLPVTVDSSQIRAINMAAEGISFVLHGPPGTGKSQTITAMIANALTKGKTVLFVAEKMAALEVVQKRLAALGIQDFCLELHSNKSTKKAVLDQLKIGLENSISSTQTDYNEKIRDIHKMRADLDAYAKALHKQRAFGKSLRQLMDIYEMIPELGKNIRFDHTYVSSLTESDLEHQIQCLERLIAAGNSIGHPHNHPLSAVHKKEYSQRIKFDLKAVIKAFETALKKFQESVLSFVADVGVDVPVAENEWKNICNYAVSIVALENIPVFLRNTKFISKEFEVPKNYIKHRDDFNIKKAEFLSKWNDNFLKMDMDIFRNKYDRSNKKIFGKGRALALLKEELQVYASFTVETDKIPVYLTDISFYQEEAKEVVNIENELPYEWKEILKSYTTMEALQEYENNLQTQLKTIDKFSDKIHIEKTEDVLKLSLQSAKILIQDWEEVNKAETEITDLLDLVFENNEKNWIESRLEVCKSILENASLIKDWIVYRQILDECKELGLEPVCNAYESGIPDTDVIDVYLSSIYREIILSVIESEPVLNDFTGTEFNERISQFKKLDEEFMELTKSEMVYKLTHQLPTSSDSVQVSKELNILRRAITSNGRGISIRTLFEQIPNILTKICPCMLMSPISVAQYMAAKNDLFDIVIFDEASQLPTCKAVGALARGKNAVIVGDPNQMPPTSFFAGNTVDEDNLDIEDLDSILDDCLALGMPQTNLHWHYRSRHESLIAFSNQEFYENSMLTFPSINDRVKSVSLVKVDGFFNRGKDRVNENEAIAIVNEIKRRYLDPELSKQTIGVVTFNISQQTLIEDLLMEEYKRDVEFDKWANIGEEALFVKNLENVQGDERDIILFSIAFGPDADGKLSLNFGPLNKNGGWKRLNVAVSRARLEMIVFSTMTADMINLKRTKSKGVESLKNFLEFAEKGKLQGEYIETRIQKDQGIMEHICRQIVDAGFKYQKAVGHSRFKVDIAVVNPYNKEEYLLGIMLDGDSYKQSQNTKDREVSQINVLKGLGWTIHRIWTMDWWDNRDKELSKLLNILEKQKSAAFEKHQKMNLETAEMNKNSEEVEIANKLIKKSEENIEVIEDTYVTEDIEVSEDNSENEIKLVDVMTAKENSVLNIDNTLALKNMNIDNTELKTAIKNEVNTELDTAVYRESSSYRVEKYVSAELEITSMSTSDFIQKSSLNLIAEKMQQIIDVEAPVNYDYLIRKTLRTFEITRSSTQTLEAADKAFKKTLSKTNKQAGVKYIWRKDQDPDNFRIYRLDFSSDNRRNLDEVCQQELKNAICATLKDKGALNKDTLIKETIRTMGYSRNGTVLASAIERGLKYGRKTGEIIQNNEKLFILNININ